MPNPLQKSLNGYLSKIKRETEKLQLSSKPFSSSKKWVLSGCKHPKTLSLSFNTRRRSFKTRNKTKDDANDDGSSRAATLSDIDRFLEENFRSLCVRDGADDEEREHEGEHDPMRKKKGKRKSSDEDDDSDVTEDEDKDEKSSSDDEDYYRHRFERTWGRGPAVYDSPKESHDVSADLSKRGRLFPPPGSSGLLTEEGRPSMASTSTTEDIQSRSNSSTHRSGPNGQMLPENCIAVLKYTQEPLEDFRRSMVEMMESKLGSRESESESESEVDWELMEELLFCYLELNEKKSHRFILSAFVDLIVVLREKEKSIRRRGWGGR